MPHHAPAENNAATATKPSTTLNPGRELPGRESARGNHRTRGGTGGVGSLISDGVSNVSSATVRSGNSTKSAETAIGRASPASTGSGIGRAAGGAGRGGATPRLYGVFSLARRPLGHCRHYGGRFPPQTFVRHIRQPVDAPILI